MKRKFKFRKQYYLVLGALIVFAGGISYYALNYNNETSLQAANGYSTVKGTVSGIYHPGDYEDGSPTSKALILARYRNPKTGNMSTLCAVAPGSDFGGSVRDAHPYHFSKTRSKKEIINRYNANNYNQLAQDMLVGKRIAINWKDSDPTYKDSRVGNLTCVYGETVTVYEK